LLGLFSFQFDHKYYLQFKIFIELLFNFLINFNKDFPL